MGFFGDMGRNLSGSNSSGGTQTAYQKNLQTVNVPEPEQDTTRSVLGKILKVYQNDPEKGNMYMGQLQWEQSNPESQFYNPYTKPTNKAVGYLNDLGIDTSNIDDNWYDQWSGLKQYYKYTANTNSLSSTMIGKKSSAEEKAAYNYNQLVMAEEQTRKAETEWQALQEELTYWAQRTDRNYSDDEILKKIDWNKYKTLQKMDETRLAGTPMELNRAIGYSEDALYGVLWAARNNGGTGNPLEDMANSYLGTGTTWQYNPEIADKLDPTSENFSPYSVGSTNIDDAAVYFGVSSFGKNWLQENNGMQWSDDETQKKMYQKVLKAEENQTKAEEELTRLNDWIDKRLKSGTDPEKILGKIKWSDYPTLAAMDKSIGKEGMPGTGDLIAMTRGVDYRYADLKQRVYDQCAANAAKGNGDDFSTKISNVVSGGVDAVTGAAPIYQKTQQEMEVAKEQDKILNDGADTVSDITTPAEKAAMDNAWSMTFTAVKNVWSAVKQAGIQAAQEIAGNNQTEVMNNHASDTLGSFQTIYDYEMNEQNIDAMELELDEIKKMLGDKVYAGRKVDPTKERHITINGQNYYVRLSNTYSEDGSYYVDDINVISNGDPFGVDDETFSAVEASDAVQKLLGEFNSEAAKIGEANQNGAALTDEEAAAAKRARELELEIEDAKANHATYEDAYLKSKKTFDDAQTKRDEAIHMMKALGVDTSELEKEDAVIGYLVNFGEYERTVWSAYNPSDAYRIAIAQGEDRETVLAQAKKGNDAVTQELEEAKAVRAYIDETGLSIPQNYLDNLDRHIAKLERDQKDYEYFTLSLNNDFDTVAQRGREIEAAARNPVMAEGYGEFDDNTLISKMGPVLLAEMNEDEKNTYYYLIGKGDEKSADEYIYSLKNGSFGVLHTRFTNELKEETRAMVGDGGENKNTAGFIGANILSILASPAAAMASLGYAGYSLITGEEMNPDNALLVFNNFRTTTREQSAEAISNYYGEGTVGQKLVQGFYEIVSNRLDSMINAATFGGLTSGIGNSMLNELVGASPMGISAAMDSMMDAKRKGASDAQAYGIGLVTFLAETGTEAISLDNIKEAFKIGEEVTQEGLKEFMKNWLTKAGISEMIGESANDIIENYWDEKIMGELSDHSDRVWSYRMQGYEREDAEAMARMDELKGVLHTALISYLSPGLDVVSYGIGRANYYREKTRQAQMNGDNRNILEVLRGETAEAKQQEADNHEPGAIEAPVRNAIPEQGRIEVVNAPEEGAGTAVLENEEVLIGGSLETDYEILESAKTADTSSQTATVSSVLDVLGTEESSDVANAAAANIEGTIGGGMSAAEFVQELTLGAYEGNVDGALVKQAIQNAALSQNSAAYQVMQTSEYIHADLDQKAQMLAATVETDAANANVANEVNKAVYEYRVAEAEKELILNGGLTEAQRAQETADAAASATEAAQDELDARQADMAAKGQNLQTANEEFQQDPGNHAKADMVNHALSELQKSSEVEAEYQQQLDNAQERQQKAEADAQRAKEQAMAVIRQQAQQAVEEQNMQRAERQAQEAEAAKVKAEQEEQQRIDQEATDNASTADVDTYIEQYHPDATEEEKQKIREVFAKVQSELPAASTVRDENGQLSAEAKKNRDKFIKRVSQKFGVQIDIMDTTQGGNVDRQNGYVDLKNNRIVLDETSSMDDAMFFVLGHELTHIAEKSGTYDQLAQTLLRMRYGDDDGRLAADIRARKNLYDFRLARMHEQDNTIDATPLTEEQAAQEIVADIMGDLLRGDQDLANRLVAEDPSLARRIIDSIKSFIKKAVGMKGAWLSNAQQTVDMLETALKDAQAKQYSETQVKHLLDNKNEALNSDFANQYDQWDGTSQGVVFTVGKPSETLQSIGVPDAEIRLSSDTVLHVKKKHPGMSDEVIKQIPSIVNHPLLVMDSATVSGRITMFGEVMDDNGAPVLAIMETNPSKDVNANIDFLPINSAYGKDTYLQEFIDKSNILFMDKNRADNWAASLRLDLPSASTTIGSTDESIAPDQQVVKPLSMDDQGNDTAVELPGGTVDASPVIKHSLSSFTPEEQENVRKALLKTGKWTTEQVDKYLGDAMGIASMIAADPVRLDFKANDVQTMLKPNQEYKFTVDASTLCAKRLLYQGTFDAIQHALPNTPLMPEDLIDLSNLMREMGYETPCGICYVESRRRHLDKFASEWLDSYDGEYKPTLDQVTSTDGLESLRQHPKDSPEHKAYQDFVDAMSHKGVANPKVVQLRTDYRGEIRDLHPMTVKGLINHGGLRLQSFSDFETPHLLDMMQVVMDMASKKLTSQAYTKVPNFAWVFGDTGVKINLSLIGKGAGVDANGQLLFDDVEGMPFEEAMKLRERYSKNVGTILVGINDDHIIAAMGDNRIDYIIPFHKSGWSDKELSKMPVLNGYSDYTNSQNEKKIKGKKADGTGYDVYSADDYKVKNFEPVGQEKANGKGKDGYWDFGKTGRENAETYLEMCAKDGRVPKFSQFLVDNGDGSFSLPSGGDARSTAIREGYWKTLVDFKMYDNDGVGSPQLPVTPDINMDQAMRVLNDYSLDRNGIKMADNNSLPVAQPVVERYVEQYKAQHPLDETRTKYSLPSPEVEEAAEKAFPNTKARTPDGKLMPLYHGTSADFTVFDTSVSGGKNGVQEGYGIYLTDNPEIPKQYGGRIISAYVDMERPAYADKKTFKRSELTKVIKAACEKEAQQFVDEGSYDNVKDAVGDTWISNYVYTPEYRTIDEAYRAVADLILDQNDNDSDIIGELLIGQGIRDYGRAMDFYHNILTPLTGFDGIWAKWNNRDTGEISNVLLAFDSSQIKSNEPVTYDDNGDPIPMEQRFDRSNPDIRYSLPETDSDGKQLTAEQQDFFRDSKAVDDKGRLVKLYHGTDSAGFTVFEKSDDIGYFFTDSKQIAQTYSNSREEFSPARDEEWDPFDNSERMNYGVYLNLKDPLIIDGGGDNWDSVIDHADAELVTWDELTEEQIEKISENTGYDIDDLEMWGTGDRGENLAVYDIKNLGIREAMKTRDWVEMAVDMGCDGVIFKNISDEGKYGSGYGWESNVYVALKPEQIKSVNNTNPTGNRDIRYSLPEDAPYLAAVERGEMDEAAKDVKEYAASKGFDTSEKAYHGTPLFGFTRFDMQNSQDEIFVAYNPKTAGTYSFGGEVRDIASTRDRQDVSEMDADTFLDAVKKYIRKRPNSGGHGVISAKYVTADDLANIVSNKENFLKKALYGRTWDQATENVKSTLLNATKNAFGYYDVKSLMEDLRNAKSPLDYLNTYLDYLKNNPYENGDTPWPSNDSMNRGATVENALNILVNNYAELDNQIWQDYATYATRDIMQAYAGLQKAQNGEPLIAIMSSGKDSSPYTVYYTRSNLEDQVDMQRDIVGDSGIYQFYTRPGNQFVVDAKGALWRNISVPEISDDLLKTRDIAEWARENGYDSVRINNVYDNGGRSGERSDGFGDIGIFFNPMDVKSADTVTRDSDGNIIPLSERFDSYNADFRYSLPSDNLLEQQIRNYLSRGGSLSENTVPPAGNEVGFPGMKAQRQFGRRTAQTSDALHQEVKDYLYNHSSYTPDSNQAQINRALDWVQSKANGQDPDGYNAAVNEVTSNSFDYRSADGQARMLTVMGMAALKNDLSTELRIADAYNKQGTDLGRQLQARKLFRLMTPIGRISVLNNMVDQINDQYARSGNTHRVALSEGILDEAANAQTEEDFQRTQRKAAQELAKQMPGNWKDKLRGWRMLSMLGNPRTHIRNIVGNALFVPVVSMKNKLGALGEIATRQDQRTKTLAPVLSKEIRDFAKQDALTMKNTLTGEAKYNESSMVEREQKPFKGLLQAIIDFNSDMLEKEDWAFMKGHYKRALGGWMQANGYTAEQLQNDPALLEQGRAYAIQEAQRATYRDFSALASWLNHPAVGGHELKGAKFAIDAILPFKKTPANILKRGIEYSPAGIMRSLTTDIYHLKQWNDYQSGKLDVLPDKAISPNQFIDRLCSGLSGTAIMAVGALLSSAGIVTCGLDDDDDKNEKEQGNQEYSFKFSIGGHDYTYTIDWAAPMAMPFFVGAAIQEQLANQKDFDVERLVNAYGNITEPVFNLSMLDGVNSLLKLSQNNGQNSNTTITQLGAKVISNYATSYVPSLLGAIARTVDDTSRKAFVEQGKGNGVLGTFRYAREQVENKIPGLSQTNISIRDVFGNAKTSSLAERIFENFISPGYIEEYKNNPVLKEMDRLYNANVTDSEDMVPKDPSKSITYKNEKHVLIAEEWDTYKKERGQTAYTMLTELINSPDYQNADDAAQVQMINKVWDYAGEVGKSAVIADYEIKNSGKDPVQNVISEGKVSSYSASMMTALDNGDYGAYDTMVEALHQEGVEDSTIRTKIGNKYRDQYKDAYLKGDYDRMAEIEELLDNTGFDFDLDKWEKDADEKREKREGGSLKPIGYVASAGGMPSRGKDTTGQYGLGNIDLNNRPVVHNDDGSISTEVSMSFYDEDTGKEVLIPTVINGEIVSEEEAIDHYYETGEYLGMFDTWQEADEYAEKLHNRQDWYYNR